MSNVVEQCRKANDSAGIGVPDQFIRQEPGDMCDPEGMIKSRVESAWIDEACHGKLPNSPQPLKDPRIDNRRFLLVHRDEAVNWVTYFLKMHTLLGGNASFSPRL
jgi:hypothetical protein